VTISDFGIRQAILAIKSLLNSCVFSCLVEHIRPGHHVLEADLNKGEENHEARTEGIDDCNMLCGHLVLEWFEGLFPGTGRKDRRFKVREICAYRGSLP
jgi:hypothetical protein